MFSLEARDIVVSAMCANSIKIVDAGTVDEPTREMVNEQYKNVSKHAMHVKATQVVLSVAEKVQFSSEYMEVWEDALERNAVFNAADSCHHLEITSDELWYHWYKCADAGKMSKLSDDVFCCYIDSVPNKDPIYCVNGFYPAMRDSYSTGPVTYIEVEWNEDQVNWNTFLGTIIGNVNRPDSIRAKLRRITPGVAHEYIHVSSSTFQCLAEKIIWRRIQVSDDPFGQSLLQQGMPLAHVQYLASNPDYDRKPVFAYVYGLHFQNDVDMLFSLRHKPEPVASSNPRRESVVKVKKDIKKLLQAKDIEFVKNDSRLTPEGKQIVDEVAQFLVKRPELTICIESHTNCFTDKCAGKDCNLMELSQQRVECVRLRLARAGCTNEFKTHGWGCKHPVIKNTRLVRIFPEEAGDDLLDDDN